MPKFNKKIKAFSLIEILIVVALMIILATITIIAINPAKNFQDTRNAQRSSDVSAILNAVTQYTSEQGNLLSDLGTVPLCTTTPAEIGTETGMVDLTGEPLVEDYIVAIPVDPATGVVDEATGLITTGYTICQTDGGRVQIDAPGAEGGKVISVKR
jgi:type IV pilus assembly protein PilA